MWSYKCLMWIFQDFQMKKNSILTEFTSVMEITWINNTTQKPITVLRVMKRRILNVSSRNYIIESSRSRALFESFFPSFFISCFMVAVIIINFVCFLHLFVSTLKISGINFHIFLCFPVTLCFLIEVILILSHIIFDITYLI